PSLCRQPRHKSSLHVEMRQRHQTGRQSIDKARLYHLRFYEQRKRFRLPRKLPRWDEVIAVREDLETDWLLGRSPRERRGCRAGLLEVLGWARGPVHGVDGVCPERFRLNAWRAEALTQPRPPGLHDSFDQACLGHFSSALSVAPSIAGGLVR